MTSTRAAIVAVVLAFFPFVSATKAADKCLTRAEAKQVHKGAYLYWHTNASRQRCWSNRRITNSSRRMGAKPDGASARASAAKGDGLNPHLLPLFTELMPPQHAMAAPPSILDSPRWAWLAEARAAERDREPEIIFSTFAGEPPEVWPVLHPVSPGFFIVALSALTAMLLGMWFAHWHMRRLRRW